LFSLPKWDAKIKKFPIGLNSQLQHGKIKNQVMGVDLPNVSGFFDDSLEEILNKVSISKFCLLRDSFKKYFVRLKMS